MKHILKNDEQVLYETSDGARSFDRIITTIYIFKYIIKLSCFPLTRWQLYVGHYTLTHSRWQLYYLSWTLMKLWNYYKVKTYYFKSYLELQN